MSFKFRLDYEEESQSVEQQMLEQLAIKSVQVLGRRKLERTIINTVLDEGVATKMLQIIKRLDGKIKRRF